MNIVSATYNELGGIVVEYEGQPPGVTITVPDDMANRDRRAVEEWATTGGTIAAYVAPPPSPGALRIESLLSVPEVAELAGTLKTATPDEIEAWAEAHQLRPIVTALLALLAAKLQ